jgi:serine/threonine-protein kinase
MDADTPTAGLVIPPSAWPDPPTSPGGDLRPGLAPPARQTFGVPGPAAVTRQFGPDPYRPGQHTLIVTDGAGGSYGQPPARYRPAEPRLQRLLFSRKLGYLVAALVTVLLAATLGWWLTTGRYATVPKVAGLSLTAAATELRADGFKVATGRAVLDNQIGKGQVIRSLPAPGSRVGRGSQITLIPSAGPHMITMLQVTGQQLATAKAALRHAGLTPGAVHNETSATIPAGIVISTHPAAGTAWPQPKPVTLVVSAGPPVPSFVGQQKAVAEQWAQQNGVSLNEVTTTKSDAAAGTITSQSPAAGAAFTRGQVMTITISAGPPMVAIPNVDGMQVTQATHILQKLGFSVTVNQAGPLHTVFNYSPSGQAPKGSTITLWIGL